MSKIKHTQKDEIKKKNVFLSLKQVQGRFIQPTILLFYSKSSFVLKNTSFILNYRMGKINFK
jgi:hypothetical protein